MSSGLCFQPDPSLSTSSNHRQNQAKRAACDRCRGQKLRCLRETPGAGRCVRCNTAGAVCSFSVSKRAGRPPASAATSSAERKYGGKCAQGNQASTRGKDFSLDERSHDDMPDDKQGREDTGQSGSADPFMSQPLITSFMSETNWGPVADMPWIDEGLAAPYDQGDLPNSTSLDSFIQDYNWTIPSGSSDVQFNQTQASGFPIDPLTAQLKVSDEPMPDSPPLMFGIKPPDPQINTFTVGSEEVSKSSSIMDLASQPKDTTAKGGELVSERSVAESDVHHRRMQELSELGMDLYSQVIANEEYHKAQLAKSSVTPCEELVGNILKSSATFLKLLGSFYSPTTIKRSTSKASVFDSSDGEISPSEASNLSDFSDFATSTSAVTTAGIRSQDHQWKRSSLNPSLSRSSLDGNNDDGSTKPLTADMTTILQLLTCYIRIIHLHNIFYTQVHDCLTAPPDKREKPIPPIFPGMHVGGLSLDEFPNFQIKLLLQISTHMLGEIEKALGLPDGYRISKKSGQSQGILEASVSVQFVEMTMRENVRTGLMGIEKDRVKSIRDKLGSLRNLLKGTINI